MFSSLILSGLIGVSSPCYKSCESSISLSFDIEPAESIALETETLKPGTYIVHVSVSSAGKALHEEYLVLDSNIHNLKEPVVFSKIGNLVVAQNVHPEYFVMHMPKDFLLTKKQLIAFRKVVKRRVRQ